MPPNDRPVKNHLLALGSAAVLAVYGAGFTRTRAAADRFEGESARRRPVAPVATPAISVDTGRPELRSPLVEPTVESKVPKPTKTAARAVVDKEPHTIAAVIVAEKPKVEVVAPVVVDTSHLKAPVDSARAHVGYKDGIYTGWGTSRHGDIEARVEISNGRIMAASISQCLTRYSCSWISALPGQVVARQSGDVDFVSGATESTNAFYYGIQEALKKAK